MSLQEDVHAIAVRARAASERLAELSTAQKNAWLLHCAERLEAARERIREANALDMAQATEKGVAEPHVWSVIGANAKRPSYWAAIPWSPSSPVAVHESRIAPPLVDMAAARSLIGPGAVMSGVVWVATLERLLCAPTSSTDLRMNQ